MMNKYKGNQVKTDELEDEVKKLQEERTQVSKSTEEAQGDPEVAEALNASADDTLNDKQKEWAKRYADLRRHDQQKTQEFKAKEEELQEELKSLKEAQNTFPTNKEDLKKWAEEHPEVSDIVHTIAGQEASKATEAAASELREQISKLEQENTNLKASESINAVKAAHPDFNKLENDPEFHDWVEGRGEWAKTAMYSSLSPQGAIDVITLYKAEKGISAEEDEPKKRGRPPKKIDDDAAAATAVSRSTTGDPAADSTEKKTWKETEITKLTAKEFEEYYVDIKQAQKDGRFIYDMTQ